MYEFWCDYIKPKYGDKAILCYMDTDSFIMHIKTEDFNKDIANDVERWFDASNYDGKDNRHLSIGKNKKVIGKFKDELGGKIMTEFCALRAKAYAFLTDDYSDEDYEKNKIINKKDRGTKKCIVKREIVFKNYVDALFNDKVLIKSQQRFRSNHHKVFTEEVNKIALSSNDDKRIQTYDKITTYPYGTNIFKICENEMLLKNKFDDMLNNKAEVPKNELQALNDNSPVTRNEAQSLRNSSQVIRNELHELRNEAQVITNNSQALRNNSQIRRNKALVPKNKSWIIRNELHELRNESQAFRNNPQVTRNEAQSLRNNCQVIRNELHELRNEAQVIKNNSQIRRNKAQVPKNKSWIIRNELHELRNESQALRNNSQVTRNEK